MSMTLTDIRKRFFSLDFLRLISLVGKRILSVVKYCLGWLPLEALHLVYGFHLARAVFRVGNYCLNTKNRNLGETRKLVFSLFKIAISIAAIVFLATTGPWLPLALSVAFLAYGLAKLVDSVVVFFVALVRYHQLQATPENKWMRDQYRDVIQKHTSILAINVPVTLLTTVMMLGTAGAVTIGVSSPILIFTLLPLTGIVTGALLVSLSICLYRRHKLGPEDAHAKKKLNKEIKRFCILIGFWTLSSAVAVSITVASLVLPTIAPLLCLAPIIVFLLIDAVKSIYDHFCNCKVKQPRVLSLAPPNPLRSPETANDYYYRKCRILYLDRTDDKKNRQFLLTEGVVKLLELSRRAEVSAKPAEVSSKPPVPSRFRELKMDAVMASLVGVLVNSTESGADATNTSAENVKAAIFVNWMIELIGDLHQSWHELEKEDAACTQQPDLGVKRIGPNVDKVLEQDLDELLEYLYQPSDQEKAADHPGNWAPHKDNLLIPIWKQYKAGEASAPRWYASLSEQAFFHQMSDTTDYALTCERAEELRRINKSNQINEINEINRSRACEG